MARSVVLWIGLVFALAITTPSAQQSARPAPRPPQSSVPRPIGIEYPPLGAGPWVYDTAEHNKIRVVVVARGLGRAWSLAFMPDGSMLVTERAGKLRIIRNGVLDPKPIEGVPVSKEWRLAGLHEVSLHPKFAENHWVYLTYAKPRATDELIAMTLARGTWNGSALTDVRDLFTVTPWWDANGGAASRLLWAPDGMLFMTTGASLEPTKGMMMAQDPSVHKGKILRLRDDGTPAPGNPFEGKPGHLPELYDLGHRNQLGLAFNPTTGDLWAAEQGPNGGDEINIIRPGRNYGWPIVSMGNKYGAGFQGVFHKDGFEDPVVMWVPSIAASGMMFYTGDRFPEWKGNLFVGAMRTGEITVGTGHLQRVVFNSKQEQIRREILLWDLHQRIRDVRQGPDGLIYLLTEDTGLILRIEPAE